MVVRGSEKQRLRPGHWRRGKRRTQDGAGANWTEARGVTTHATAAAAQDNGC